MRSICFCNTNIAWGGGEKWHLEAALAFADRGWNVFLLCHEQSSLYAKATQHTCLTVTPLDMGRLSFLNPMKQARLTAFFRAQSIDAVILNLPADMKSMGLAAKKAGVPHIIYRRGSALPVRNTFFNRYLYGSVITRLIVNSQATKAAVFANNTRLIPEERVSILGNGIDVPSFDAAFQKAEYLPALAGRQGIILGNAGRLNRQKGQHLLLYLAASLLAMKVPFTLVIAGTGERETELKELAEQLGVSEHVIFTGFLSDLAPFWKSIDMFVLTSLWEGFGFVLLEAMLAQKPVLSFSVSNIPELVRHGDNGMLFPFPEEHDMQPMADAIKHLAENFAQQNAMGTAGRTFATTHFSQTVCMDALEALLNR